MGQKRKSSRRAHVFRYAPDSRHGQQSTDQYRNKKHNEIGNELAQTLEDRATRLARAAIIQQRLLCHRCDQAKFDCARGPVDLARQLTQAVIEKPNVVAVRLAFDGRRSVAAYRHRSCSLIDGDR
jgi:hypothetical protein